MSATLYAVLEAGPGDGAACAFGAETYPDRLFAPGREATRAEHYRPVDPAAQPLEPFELYVFAGVLQHRDHETARYVYVRPEDQES